LKNLSFQESKYFPTVSHKWVQRRRRRRRSQINHAFNMDWLSLVMQTSEDWLIMSLFFL
jgi:hypothetical protein